MSTDTYTVVSTMKNEAPYILEWVAHYKTLGFDHILVCTNDCTDTTVEILRRLQEMGLVTQHDTVVRKAGIHRSALRQASRRYDIVLNASWIFVCDVDEFLNIHLGDGSVRALVEGSGADADVISVPWRVFGPDGIERFEDKPVTQQFTKGEYEWDAEARPNTGKFVKSLYTNQHKFLRMGLHAPVSRDEHVENTRRVLPGGIDYVLNGRRTDNPPLFTHAQVNHYALRSMESFLIKRARGRANHSHHVLGKEYWDKFNLNDETDTSISRYREQTAEWLERFKRDPELADLHARGVEWHQRKAASLRMDPEMDDLVKAIEADLA
ncbi:MAG: glycosyltransferase family 2 protein [Roseovarius sp.]|uniref:glycosyltransferase family 2 protein n=1 Tax=Roseovarius sp. TaxID=1486281 RepID=UPI001B456CB2|nr:glycosyltransferase family 2 protein [Roseovarius sp.]MBQ0751328.1 glycosyltransferase family 2 protein [Roseovarius sp.]MBQ0808696.1 glycosyltransferase family 2 protein [Roseovarius sp.]